MKQIFISDLGKGQVVEGETFAIKFYKRTASRSNKPYVDLELADKTGAIRAKIWTDSLKNCEDSKEGDIVKIKGVVEEFAGSLQIIINKLSVVKDYDLGDFLQKSENDSETMFLEIKEKVDLVKNPHLKKLLANILEDEKFVKKFKEAAAAYRVHHAYVGGLLEHIIECLSLSEAVVEKYPKLNKDLLIAGIILHDIGKVYEYKISTTITFSTEGKLLGHIFIGAELVKNKAPKDIPEALLNEILHIILSHHGEEAFGSPVRPMTPEAVTVHALDLASKDIHMAYIAIHQGILTQDFTPYHRQLGTELYRSPYLGGVEDQELPF